jgi:hypothetical protein
MPGKRQGLIYVNAGRGLPAYNEELGRGLEMMQRKEHVPGDAAPAAGIYELLNIFGTLVGTRVSLAHGQSMPSAPVGHTWTRAEEEAAEC